MDLQTIFTGIAVTASLISLYYTRCFWLLTHRPIIAAEISENSSGVGVALFDLVVHNSGNRPAVNIQLNAEKENIEKILSKNVNSQHKNEVIDVFSSSNKITLLLNGKETKTAFFSFSNNGDSNVDVLEYEAELPIYLSYQDIEGRNYNSNISLSVRGAEGFGGSVWKNT